MDAIRGRKKSTGQLEYFLSHIDTVMVDETINNTNVKKTLATYLAEKLATKASAADVSTLLNLVGANADGVINKFNEIVAFLNSISDQTTLAGILSGKVNIIDLSDDDRYESNVTPAQVESSMFVYDGKTCKAMLLPSQESEDQLYIFYFSQYNNTGIPTGAFYYVDNVYTTTYTWADISDSIKCLYYGMTSAQWGALNSLVVRVEEVSSFAEGNRNFYMWGQEPVEFRKITKTEGGYSIPYLVFGQMNGSSYPSAIRVFKKEDGSSTWTLVGSTYTWETLPAEYKALWNTSKSMIDVYKLDLSGIDFSSYTPNTYMDLTAAQLNSITGGLDKLKANFANGMELVYQGGSYEVSFQDYAEISSQIIVSTVLPFEYSTGSGTNISASTLAMMFSWNGSNWDTETCTLIITPHQEALSPSQIDAVNSGAGNYLFDTVNVSTLVTSGNN